VNGEASGGQPGRELENKHMNANHQVETVEGFAGKVGEAVETAGAFAHHAADEIRQDAEKVYHEGEDCARRNIASGIVTAFVGGLVLGLLLARRERPSFQKRYLEEPLSHAQDLALALAAPLAMALRDRYDNARSAARSAAKDAADRISDFDPEPVLKGARKLGSRFKFW
jgi:ElaB/YqjD/DUF883 family membrane-anchored ribosome-binding protein